MSKSGLTRNRNELHNDLVFLERRVSTLAKQTDDIKTTLEGVCVVLDIIRRMNPLRRLIVYIIIEVISANERRASRKAERRAAKQAHREKHR